jgi:hypothetical protein
MVFFDPLSRREKADFGGFEKPDSKARAAPSGPGFLAAADEWQTAVDLLEMAA